MDHNPHESSPNIVLQKLFRSNLPWRYMQNILDFPMLFIEWIFLYLSNRIQFWLAKNLRPTRIIFTLKFVLGFKNCWRSLQKNSFVRLRVVVIRTLVGIWTPIALIKSWLLWATSTLNLSFSEPLRQWIKINKIIFVVFFEKEKTKGKKSLKGLQLQHYNLITRSR